MPRTCCEITDRAFRDSEAEAELKALHRHGPPRQTREILDAVASLGLRDARMLDIGAGVGALYHTLLDDGVQHATHVDASSAYLRIAKEEAIRRGHADRVTFIHADFTDVAESLPQADLVTLDRVVCCYPDFRALLTAAASKAARALVLSYPRAAWYTRLWLAADNLLQTIRRDPFRGFIHSPAAMHDILRLQGLERTVLKRLFVWEIALYARARPSV